MSIASAASSRRSRPARRRASSSSRTIASPWRAWTGCSALPWPSAASLSSFRSICRKPSACARRRDTGLQGNDIMDLNLRGKTALVTGASKGIGLAIARLLAEEGCNLHLVARSKDALETARDEIRGRHQVAVTLHPLDLSRGESVASLAESCRDIDILINNAGAIPGGSVEMVDEKRWREAWDLKVFGYVNMTRSFLGVMQQRGHGVILNVIGTAGERPDVGYIAGSAGTASLMAFSPAVG